MLKVYSKPPERRKKQTEDPKVTSSCLTNRHTHLAEKPLSEKILICSRTKHKKGGDLLSSAAS